MTYEMEYTMYLYSCSACGNKADAPKKKIDWNRVVQLSVEQSITYTVALAIKNNELGCPTELKNRLTSSLRGAAIKNSLKTEKILSLVDKMNSSGIKTAIIKGIDVSRFYANPECRVSSDTDLLISINDEDKAIKFLSENGFVISPRSENAHHAVGRHPSLGMVELHVMLFPDFTNKNIFENWNTNQSGLDISEKVFIGDNLYYSLEPTENLLFLTYHMIKHLVFNGISLRMMMDNALFSKHNLSRIDCNRYYSTLKKTKYLYTMQLIFGIMVKYAGFNEKDFPIEPKYDNEEIMAILDDLEDSGWQGFNKGKLGGERTLAYSYYMYKSSVNEHDKEKVSDTKKRFEVNYTQLVFPSKEHLQKRYPNLEKHPNLYPIYWTHRLFARGIPGFFEGKMLYFGVKKNALFLPADAKQKIKLFKKLKLLK